MPRVAVRGPGGDGPAGRAVVSAEIASFGFAAEVDTSCARTPASSDAPAELEEADLLTPYAVAARYGSKIPTTVDRATALHFAAAAVRRASESSNPDAPIGGREPVSRREPVGARRTRVADRHDSNGLGERSLRQSRSRARHFWSPYHASTRRPTTPAPAAGRTRKDLAAVGRSTRRPLCRHRDREPDDVELSKANVRAGPHRRLAESSRGLPPPACSWPRAVRA